MLKNAPNSNKKIYVFDTFKGIVGSNYGKDKILSDGSYNVNKDYYSFYKELCKIQCNFSKFQKKQIEIIKGDVVKTLPLFLKKK